MANENDHSQLDLEANKLALEIAQMKLAWWKKPSYLGVFLPVGLAIITLLGGIFTGFFDAERSRLKAETETLRLERKELIRNIEELQSVASQATEHLEKNVASLDSIASDKLLELTKVQEALQAQGTSEEWIDEQIEKIRAKIEEINALNATTKELLTTLPKFNGDEATSSK